MAETAQIAHDGRQGSGHDGLVERGQEHAQHQAAEDHQDLAVGEGVGVGDGLGDGWGRHGAIQSGDQRGQGEGGRVRPSASWSNAVSSSSVKGVCTALACQCFTVTRMTVSAVATMTAG